MTTRPLAWRGCLAVLGAWVAVMAPARARAGFDYIQNGGFEATTMSAPSQIIGTTPATTNVTGWTVPTGTAALIFNYATPSSVGSQSNYDGIIQLYGPDAQYTNPANGYTFNGGGNFVGADASFNNRPISQTISGLTVGADYKLSFEWAAAQQVGYTAATTSQWQATLGSESLTTSLANLPSEGFSGWMTANMVFTATSGTSVLSFLALGTPAGGPPFALLDNVSMTQVPEPATWAVLLAGVAALGAVGWRRARRAR